MKTLKEISWQITEPQYRKDPSLSYSQLKTYEHKGFEAIFTPHAPSEGLLFGSVVDTIITDGMDAFINKYAILPLQVTLAVQSILTKIAQTTNFEQEELTNIPQSIVIDCAKSCNFGGKWTDNMIYKHILTEQTITDFKIIVRQLKQCPQKTIITNKLYQEAFSTVNALRNDITTKWYFSTTPDGIDREYQLKFKGVINDVPYRCMADLILVDHKNKQIIPCDLKTTSSNEHYFWKSFHDFYYFYQAKLYYTLISQAISQDDYFKDFQLMPYRFIVINKKTLNPMIYTFSELDVNTEYTYKEKNITYRPITTVGPELYKLFQERKQQMNEKLAVEAIDEMCSGLYKLRKAFLDLLVKPKENKADNLLILAQAIANTYNTDKAYLGIDKLYQNICYMANTNEKVKIFFKWLEKSPQPYIKEFNMLPPTTKIELIQQAVSTHEIEIKNILTNRYETNV